MSTCVGPGGRRGKKAFTTMRKARITAPWSDTGNSPPVFGLKHLLKCDIPVLLVLCHLHQNPEAGVKIPVRVLKMKK